MMKLGVLTPLNKLYGSFPIKLEKGDLVSFFLILIHQNRVIRLTGWESIFVEGVDEWVWVEFLDVMDAWGIPFAGQDHHRAAHGWDAGGIGDSLRAGLFIGFLMVGDVIDVILLLFAVLLAGEDAADVGSAVGAWAQGGWIWEQGFEELNRDDLDAVIVDGFRGEHADIF